MSSSDPSHSAPTETDVDGHGESNEIHADDVEEVIEVDGGEEIMDIDDDESDGNEDEEISLENDSVAYFDAHKSSIFAICQHPKYPALVATGGSEGEAEDAPGIGYVFVVPPSADRSVLPASHNADPSSATNTQNPEIKPIFCIDGHSDSIVSMTFTLPDGDFLVSVGLDGRLKAFAVAVQDPNNLSSTNFTLIGECHEVSEINWVVACPAPEYPNTIAFGADDGSVWVNTIDPSYSATPLQIVQSYFVHTQSCTAGAWTPDGQLLATVSDDSSLYVWDVWGAAAAKGLVGDNGMSVVSLTAADQRFEVPGGLVSVAVAPSGNFLAVSGTGGAIRIVGLPRLTESTSQGATLPNHVGFGRASSRATASVNSASQAQAGAILASLQVQPEDVMTLDFAPAPQTLLAAGSVDGSIVIFDTSRTFSVRRHLHAAHDQSVVKVEFVRGATAQGWLLTSCGVDGVVRRWDLRAGGGVGADGSRPAGLVKEWRGHRGHEPAGVLGFLQGSAGERIVTAGDDAVSLVFEA